MEKLADDVAEWSKALVLGTSSKERGFKPHRRHFSLWRVKWGMRRHLCGCYWQAEEGLQAEVGLRYLT